MEGLRDGHEHGLEPQWYDFFLCGGKTKSPGIARYGMRIAGDASAWLGL